MLGLIFSFIGIWSQFVDIDPFKMVSLLATETLDKTGMNWWIISPDKCSKRSENFANNHTRVDGPKVVNLSRSLIFRRMPPDSTVVIAIPKFRLCRKWAVL